MINGSFLRGIGLTEDQISAIGEAQREEGRFRRLLIRSGVMNGAIEPIIRITEIEDVRDQKDDLLIEKIKAEYSDFIQKCQK